MTKKKKNIPDSNQNVNEPITGYGQGHEALTFEKVWLMFKETDKQFKETDKKIQKLSNLFTTL